MEPETLVTFLFKAPSDVRLVELLGSWDNFTHPYPMFHDRRRALGCWSGCFNFSDIIFDGLTPKWSKPRSGFLREGGTYWYYFRLDDEVETFDIAQTATSDCPLLPGQTLNLLHVPREVSTSSPWCRTTSTSLAGSLAGLRSLQTFEPAAKYAIFAPHSLSKVHAPFDSNMTLSREAVSRPVTAGRVSPFDILPQNDTRLVSSVSCVSHFSALSSHPPITSKTTSASGRQYESAVYSCLSTQQSRALDSRIEPADAFGHYDSESKRHILELDRGSDSESGSIGPRSVHDIQFLSSPLSPQLARVLSVQNADALGDSAKLSRQPAHVSDSCTNETANAHELSSPTFSEATLSSNGDGANTPFQPSLACPLDLGQALDKSLEDVSARLRSFKLGAGDVQTYRPRGMPELSVGKGIGDHADHHTLEAHQTQRECAPPRFRGEPQAASTRRDVVSYASISGTIFTELGYLGGVIS